MPLSCYCGDDDYAWIYHAPYDYKEMPKRARRTRCASCHELIEHGAVVTEFPRYRSPLSDVEENIYGAGDDVPLASMWHCERCADLWFSLHELGYRCIGPDENVLELVREYAAIKR